MNEKIKVDVMVSFLISTLAIIVFIGMGISSEVNDDLVIAQILAAEDNNFSLFQPKVFTLLISELYRVLPNVEWWIVGQVIMVLLSSATIIYIVKRKFPLTLFIALCIPLIIFINLFIVKEVNFTRTAGLVSIAGSMLLVYAVEMKVPYKKIGVLVYVYSFLLLLVAVSYRAEMAFTALPFAIVSLFTIIFDRENSMKKNARKLISQGGLALMIIALVLGYGLGHGIMYNETEKMAIEYNRSRASVQDYAQTYPEYTSGAQDYAQFGISENDFQAIFNHWITADTEFFTTEKFNAIKDNLSSTENISYVERLIELGYSTLQNIDVYYMICFIAIMFMCASKRQCHRMILIGLVYVFISAYIALGGRIQDRVFEPLLLCLLLFLTYLSGGKNNKWDEHTRKMLLSFNNTDSTPKLVYLVVNSPRKLIMYAILFFCIWLPMIGSFVFGVSFPYLPIGEPVDYNTQIIYDYIKADVKNAYILPTDYSQQITNYSIWTSRTVTDIQNIFLLGGWTANMPYNRARMERYDIDNPMLSLTQNENTVSFYDEVVYTYLKEHVDENVKISYTDKIIGLENGIVYKNIVVYCEPLNILQSTVGDNSAHITQFHPTVDERGVPSYYIEGVLPIEEREQYTMLYFHVTERDESYTYKMNINESDVSFAVTLSGLGQDFYLQSDTTVDLYARTIEGNLVKIKDVSGAL